MDRTNSFPKQDFEGMATEIWQGLNICLYHAAYVRIYADSTAMRQQGFRLGDDRTDFVDVARGDGLAKLKQGLDNLPMIRVKFLNNAHFFLPISLRT